MSATLLLGTAWLGLAAAAPPDCSDGHAAQIAELEQSGSRRAYDCLAADDQAPAALLAAAATEAPSPRLTRALAVWRLHRLDDEIGDDEARAYGASDRRLLLDGIKAHRGRASPAPDHLVVFETLAWYAPEERYTDGRLTAVDRQNIAVLERPPVLPPAPVEAPPVEAPAERPEAGCGCTAAPASRGRLPGLLLLLGLSSRRRPGPAASAAPRRAARPPGG